MLLPKHVEETELFTQQGELFVDLRRVAARHEYYVRVVVLHMHVHLGAQNVGGTNIVQKVGTKRGETNLEHHFCKKKTSRDFLLRIALHAFCTALARPLTSTPRRSS